jgi:hypothetical protein
MATIDFNLLRSEGPQNLYEGFLQGQKAGAAEQERNMLRQSQMQQMEAQRENILAQREQRLAQASQQQSAEAGRRRRQEVLGRLSSSFEANGLTLDRKTLGEMYKAGLELGDNTLITTATTGLKALDDEERDKAEMARFGLSPAPAAAAPAPANAFAVPPLAEGAAPAPVNAMVDRGRVQQMIMSPSPRVRQMGQALAGTLEKPEAPPKLSDRFVPVGKLVFDRESQKFIQPPAGAVAATEPREPVQKAPAGYRFTSTGDLEPIPGGPAAAPATKPLTPQQEAARRDKVGKEYKNVGTALQSMQDVMDSVTSVKGSALGRVTGFASYVPSMPGGAAATAEVRLKNLEGKLTSVGKSLASMSGAIGSIANQEWKILRDQVAAIDVTKGEGPLREQLDLVEAQIQGAMERIRDAYVKTYGEDFERFPQFGELPEPKSTTKGAAPKTLSPEDKQALDWANSNPTDPRSARIKQRLGVK